MCDHQFTVVRERGAYVVFVCTRCLEIQRRFLPVHAPKEPAVDEAAENWRWELLASADRQALLFAEWLDDRRLDSDEKQLRSLLAVIDETIRNCQAARWIADDHLAPLLTVRLAMLERLCALEGSH